MFSHVLAAQTARPPGSVSDTMALPTGGKRPFRRSRQQPRRCLLKMLRCRAPTVYAPQVSRRSGTLGTAAPSAPSTRDDSWISSPRGRPPKLCTTVDRQTGDLWRSRSVPPVFRDAPEKPALVARSGRCRPSSLARARQLRFRLCRPRPTTACTQLASTPPPVVRSVDGAPLRRSAGASAAVQWPICVVADWLPAALASSTHLAYRWSLSGGAAVRHDFAVPVPWWSEPSRSTCSLPTHSQLKPTLSVCAAAFIPQQQLQQQQEWQLRWQLATALATAQRLHQQQLQQQQHQQQQQQQQQEEVVTMPTGQLVMRGPHVVGLDLAVPFSVQLQRLRDADRPAPVDCSECSTNFSSLEDVCVCQCGAPRCARCTDGLPQTVRTDRLVPGCPQGWYDGRGVLQECSGRLVVVSAVARQLWGEMDARRAAGDLDAWVMAGLPRSWRDAAAWVGGCGMWLRRGRERAEAASQIVRRWHRCRRRQHPQPRRHLQAADGCRCRSASTLCTASRPAARRPSSAETQPSPRHRDCKPPCAHPSCPTAAERRPTQPVTSRPEHGFPSHSSGQPGTRLSVRAVWCIPSVQPSHRRAPHWHTHTSLREEKRPVPASVEHSEHPTAKDEPAS